MIVSDSSNAELQIVFKNIFAFPTERIPRKHPTIRSIKLLQINEIFTISQCQKDHFSIKLNKLAEL